jgi:hypothetical protein
MTSSSFQHQLLRSETRRHFFRNCGIGVGAIALSDLLQGGTSAVAAAVSVNPLQPKINAAVGAGEAGYLSVHGRWSVAAGYVRLQADAEQTQRTNPSRRVISRANDFAFMNSSHKTNLLGSRSPDFGSMVIEEPGSVTCLPHTGRIVDKLTFLHTCKTDLFNHAPAKLFMNTGTGHVWPSESRIMADIRAWQRM